MKNQGVNTYEFNIVRLLSVEVINTVWLSADTDEEAMAIVKALAENESLCPEIDTNTKNSDVNKVEVTGYRIEEGVE